MYIEQYWGDYIGGSDDSMTLMEYLASKPLTLTVGEIFADIGFSGDAKTESLAVEIDELDVDFQSAISVIADIAALLLECKVNGGVDLGELWEELDGRLTLAATAEEHDMINEALAKFVQSPMDYDISEMLDEDELQEMAELFESLRQELYG